MSGNVIFIHPDGTSPSHFAAARLAAVGPDGRLNWDEMTEAGVYLGHLDDSIVSTSNGGAVVHAYGVKAASSSFGLDEDGRQYTSLAGQQGVGAGAPNNTIMEDAIAAGRPTAVINSGFIAEPGTGVFLASADNRRDTEAITAQIVESGVNVILGGGETDYLPVGTRGFFGEEGTRTDGRNLIEEATALGYTVVFTLEQLRAVDPQTEKLLGIFAAGDTYNDDPEGALIDDGLVQANGDLILYGQPPRNPNPPTVADMLRATLNLNLFRNEDEGFFIVLEEEGTDNFGNNNNAAGTIEAVLRADAAIGVAQDFVETVNPNTLILTAADSDAGGLEVIDRGGDRTGTISSQPFLNGAGNTSTFDIALDGQTGSNTAPFVTGAPDQDGDRFSFGVAWAGLQDFAGGIVSKAFGLNADQLPATVDNTGIYRLMYETLFDVDLNAPAGVPADPTPAPRATQATGGVIFIHPDGAAPSHYAAARLASQGADGRLNWDRMSEAGVYLGHLDDRIVATSNGGAVTHAYGVKAVASSFGFDENGVQYTSAAGTPNTLMEDAIAAGKPTAIINSGFIAEPGTGAFLASVASRNDTAAITAQILASGVNVILGGGETDYLPVGTTGFFGEEGTRTDGRNLIDEARAAGYTVVFTLEQLQAVSPGTEKLLGIFAAGDTYNDTFEDRLRQDGLVDNAGNLQLYGQPPTNPNPPTVAQMLATTLGLDLFRNAQDGFMVVLEEEGTDNFGNNNNGPGAVEAVLRADAAIGVAMDFVNTVNPNTLVLTAADSDAGGLEVDDNPANLTRVQPNRFPSGNRYDGFAVPADGRRGNSAPFQPFVAGVPDVNGDRFEFGTLWTGTPDFAGSIVSKAYGLNAEMLGATVDNTDLYALMYRTLFGIDPEANVNPITPTDPTPPVTPPVTPPIAPLPPIDTPISADLLPSTDLMPLLEGAMGTPVVIKFKRGAQIQRFRGSQKRDRLAGTNGSDRLLGKGGNDRLLGKTGKDNLAGGKGNDILKGGGGPDQLNGGDGRDRLSGQRGSDILIGGKGDDILNGGASKDMFVYTSLKDGTDTIKKFEVTQDVIDLRKIFNAPAFTGSSDFQRFTEFVSLVEANGSTEVRVDTDGLGTGVDTTLLAVVQGVTGLTSENFVVS
ncbi:MAG: alkaline phosphatase [Synechococcales bacterium]|nr:alkaline phosphatase [Synechococcales bacterium]